MYKLIICPKFANFQYTCTSFNFSAQGKREKKSSKKSKKAAAAAVEDDQPSETGTGGGASGGGGRAAELFDLDMGSQQKQEPVSRFQVLAEDENLKMVGTHTYMYMYYHKYIIIIIMAFMGAKD